MSKTLQCIARPGLHSQKPASPTGSCAGIDVKQSSKCSRQAAAAQPAKHRLQSPKHLGKQGMTHINEPV
ncbi:hypothetical protein SAMN04488032_1307 [Pacificibacter marinus]|uniref:Uncharacterized protein n=1 Tax=Pacificibacter marinus TaxID=658057 RepID=A0A1Y5TRZ3_9RHOB|nr:hypothetical protein SAMN04488032_1307 [Pacificibacter marinus]SLN70073.1 hypothetical protein PAM7971_03745 [Pacificibacter marinus]